MAQCVLHLRAETVVKKSDVNLPGLSFMVVMLPGPPSPSTSTASMKPAQTFGKMVLSPVKATFHIRSADTAKAHSSVMQPATILSVSLSIRAHY